MILLYLVFIRHNRPIVRPGKPARHLLVLEFLILRTQAAEPRNPFIQNFQFFSDFLRWLNPISGKGQLFYFT
ncbi:hypothetical protein MPTK1_1g29420 [Marchantia polymorpha subsp. ruderalis]|uniref:Uncharacterized protein n=2 Tax=Marchantia polymorpha TaxID=3197 RepID=A0AAF6AVI9_MARPO|nr:hypothetical protein MARPO_0107s0057 [Marchantia polymorpha]BBN00460.1 hypothetical protein Mp_1g29420 [Marchantia polymorpha subsp. ruderalis]|eukprot:PTQ31790.1 hypothetical protein MARPO_0107s0057 [Marchantia polymorpha]